MAKVKFSPQDAKNVRDMINKRRFEPTNLIDTYEKKANKIKHDNIYNYKYTYMIKTPNGMREDTERNHKYGTTRDGYEKWKTEEKGLTAGYSGRVSLREITDYQRKDENGIAPVVGYIIEEKLSDYPWQQEIAALATEAFDKLCEELEVVDKEMFEYVLWEDFGLYKDYGQELSAKLSRISSMYEKYQEDEEYKKFIDKIKG